MSDLFSADTLRLTRTARAWGRLDYEVTGPGGPVARAVQRSGSPATALRMVFTQSHPARVFDVGTDAGSPRLVLTLSAGKHFGFDLDLATPEGRVVGRASAVDELRVPAPEVVLTDPVGAALGTVTGGLPMQLSGPTGAALASVTIGAPDELEPFNKGVIHVLELAPELPPDVRDLVVAVTIARDAVALST